MRLPGAALQVDLPDTLELAQAAFLLGLHPETVRLMCVDGTLRAKQATRKGRPWTVPASAVLEKVTAKDAELVREAAELFGQESVHQRREEQGELEAALQEARIRELEIREAELVGLLRSAENGRRKWRRAVRVLIEEEEASEGTNAAALDK